MHLVHFCSSLLVPSKYKSFLSSSKYSFIAAMTPSLLPNCSTKVVFQFWEQIEVRRGHIRRIWGMGKDFESAFSRSNHGNLRRLSRRIVLQEQNTSSQFSSPLSCNFLAQAPRFCCIISTIYRATLFKIINHDYPLTIRKDWGHHLPCRRNYLGLLGRGEPGCFNCILCIFDSVSK